MHDLWRTDLDAFLAQWEFFEVSQAQLESTRPGQSKKALNLKKPKPKKKALNSDGESDVSLEEMDHEFEPIQKKVVKRAGSVEPLKPAAKKKSPAAAAVPAKKVSSPVSRVADSLSSVGISGTSGTNAVGPKKRVLGGQKGAVVKGMLGGKPPTGVAKAAEPPVDLMDEEDSDEVSIVRKPVKPTASKAVPQTKKPMSGASKPTKKRMIQDSEEESDEGSEIMSVVAAPRAARAISVTAQKGPIVLSDDDETEKEEEDDFSQDESEQEDDSDF